MFSQQGVQELDAYLRRGSVVLGFEESVISFGEFELHGTLVYRPAIQLTNNVMKSDMERMWSI